VRSHSFVILVCSMEDLLGDVFIEEEDWEWEVFKSQSIAFGIPFIRFLSIFDHSLRSQ